MRCINNIIYYFGEIIKNSHDIDNLSGRIYSAIQEETRHQMPLENYGYNLLSEQFNHIVENGFEIEDEYDLANKIFTYPRMYRTLTYNIIQA